MIYINVALILNRCCYYFSRKHHDFYRKYENLWRKYDHFYREYDYFYRKCYKCTRAKMEPSLALALAQVFGLSLGQAPFGLRGFKNDIGKLNFSIGKATFFIEN